MNTPADGPTVTVNLRELRFVFAETTLTGPYPIPGKLYVYVDLTADCDVPNLVPPEANGWHGVTLPAQEVSVQDLCAFIQTGACINWPRVHPPEASGAPRPIKHLAPKRPPGSLAFETDHDAPPPPRLLRPGDVS